MVIEIMIKVTIKFIIMTKILITTRITNHITTHPTAEHTFKIITILREFIMVNIWRVITISNLIIQDKLIYIM